MDRRIYLNDLYDFYKGLFTEKQQKYFEEYYYDNLTLSEIAENNKISRNAVHNQLKIVELKLEELESILKLFEKKKRITKILENKIDNETLEKISDLL